MGKKGNRFTVEHKKKIAIALRGNKNGVGKSGPRGTHHTKEWKPNGYQRDMNENEMCVNCQHYHSWLTYPSCGRKCECKDFRRDDTCCNNGKFGEEHKCQKQPERRAPQGTPEKVIMRCSLCNHERCEVCKGCHNPDCESLARPISDELLACDIEVVCVVIYLLNIFLLIFAFGWLGLLLGLSISLFIDLLARWETDTYPFDIP